MSDRYHRGGCMWQDPKTFQCRLDSTAIGLLCWEVPANFCPQDVWNSKTDEERLTEEGVIGWKEETNETQTQD